MTKRFRGYLLMLSILLSFAGACQPIDEAPNVEPRPEPNATAFVVGNSGSSGVEAFLAGGESRGFVIEPDAGGLRFPDAVIVGPEGNFYVSSGCRATPDKPCEKSSSAVLLYGRDGSFLRVFAAGESLEEALYRPYGTAFGPDGLFYVASFMSNQILRYDSNGQFQDVFAEGDGKDPEGLNGPNGLAFDGDGSLYVTTEGSTVTCPNPQIEDNCAPTFSANFPSLLLRYDLETKQSTVFDQPTEANTSLAAIRFGPNGLLFVGDFSNNIIRVYDIAEIGAPLYQIQTAGSSSCDDALQDPCTGYFVFEESGALLVTVGAQCTDDDALHPGAVLRLTGERYDKGSCLVGPTAELDRPAGIALAP